VPLVTRRVRALELGGTAKNLQIELRLPDAAQFVRATAQGPTHAGEQPVRLRRDGKRLTLTLREHAAATLVCLYRKR
jgi:hypothetical protein